MAKDTGGYRVFPFEEMLRTTVKETDLSAMFTARFFNRLYFKPMTLYAILFLQRRVWLIGSKRTDAEQENQNYHKTAFDYPYIDYSPFSRENCFHNGLSGVIVRSFKKGKII